MDRIEPILRDLISDRWIITSTYRKNDVHHREGRAIDALPPHKRNGVMHFEKPLYFDSRTLELVELKTKLHNINGLVEEGHVHFFWALPLEMDSVQKDSSLVAAFVKGAVS